MISIREFLQDCVYSIITLDLEEVLFEKLNVSNKKELWLALNEHGYFINHYQDSNGKYMHEIVPMSKKVKKKYREMLNDLDNGITFGRNLENLKFGGR